MALFPASSGFLVPNFGNQIYSGSFTHSTASTFSYTVTQDSFLSITFQRTEAGFTYILINGNIADGIYSSGGYYGYSSALIPVKKGDVITAQSTATDTKTTYVALYGLR